MILRKEEGKRESPEEREESESEPNADGSDGDGEKSLEEIIEAYSG